MRELIAHFRDGLENQTVEEMMNSFGDPNQTARLIRRAKVRNRSLASRVVVYAAPLLALGAVLYVLAAAHGQMVDYLAKTNELALAVPEADRAWPIYREAMIRSNFVDLDTSTLFVPQDDGSSRVVRPGDASWGQAKVFLVLCYPSIDG
jgi:hypothetical protein